MSIFNAVKKKLTWLYLLFLAEQRHNPTETTRPTSSLPNQKYKQHQAGNQYLALISVLLIGSILTLILSILSPDTSATLVPLLLMLLSILSERTVRQFSGGALWPCCWGWFHLHLMHHMGAELCLKTGLPVLVSVKTAALFATGSPVKIKRFNPNWGLLKSFMFHRTHLQNVIILMHSPALMSNFILFCFSCRCSSHWSSLTRELEWR